MHFGFINLSWIQFLLVLHIATIVLFAVMGYKCTDGDAKKARMNAGVNAIISVFMGGLVYWCLGLTIGGMICMSDNVGEKHYFVGDTRNIVSIRTSDQIEGSFFIGSGYIGSTEYYVAFGERDDGGVERVRYRAARAAIYETDDRDPCVETVRLKMTYEDSWFKRKPFVRGTCSDTYRIYVPKGTIVAQFKLD